MPVNEIIKQRRLEKNISVETIFKEIHVPSKFVYMIENGEWDKFPSEVHLKGFLKLYAEYMEIEPSLVERCIKDSSRNGRDEVQNDRFCWKGLHKTLTTAKSVSLILLFAVILIILYILITSVLPE